MTGKELYETFKNLDFMHTQLEWIEMPEEHRMVWIKTALAAECRVANEIALAYSNKQKDFRRLPE